MPQFIDIAARALFSYLLLLILTRIMGKREISQLTYFDYIVGITIGSIAGIMVTNTKVNWYSLAAGLIVFAALQLITALLSLKSIRVRELVNGKSRTLIRKGNIIEENLRKERLNTSELASMLRQKNIYSFADVEYAVLETDGKISTQLKPGKRPVTPSDMKLQTGQTGLPRIIIQDGELVNDTIENIGLTRAWIMSKLGEAGAAKVSDVMLAQVDDTGNIYVDQYEKED